MRWPLLVSTAILTFAGAVEAQDNEVLLERLRTKRQLLLQRDSEIERLYDLMIQHHLGIRANLHSETTLTAAERLVDRNDLERRVLDLQDEVTQLNLEHREASERLTKLGTAVESPVEEDPEAPWSSETPTVTITEPVITEPARKPSPTKKPEEPKGINVPSPSQAARTTPPVLIRGTIDHAKLGIAFFRAGDYERAIEELEEVTKGEDTEPLTLFQLARSYEKARDYARADSTFLRIEAMAEGDDSLKGWSETARTARQHMNWMRDNSEWRPPTTREEK